MTPLEYEYRRQVLREQAKEQMGRAAAVIGLHALSKVAPNEDAAYDPWGQPLLREALIKEIVL